MPGNEVHVIYLDDYPLIQACIIAAVVGVTYWLLKPRKDK